MFNFENVPALDLNKSNIEHANNASMFEAGDAIARDAERVYRAGLQKMFEGVTDPNERQAAIIETRAASWRELCEKSFNEALSRRASWVPWTVSGPANYPAKRMNARADKAIQVSQEWSTKRAAFIENTRAMLRDAIPFEDILAEYRSGKRGDAISSDDPHALEKIAARLEGLKERHELKKAINAHWRKHKTACGCPGISEKAAASIDESMKPENNQFGKSLPYPAWSLSNGLAEIKRLEQRLQEVQRMKERAESTPETNLSYDGFTVRISAQDCRVYVDFASKPDVPARDILKANGFHWSPREGSWGRKLTNNAAWSVKHIVIPRLLALDEYGELPAAEEQPEQAEQPEQPAAQSVSLDEFAAQYAQEEPEDDIPAFVASILMCPTSEPEPMTDNDAFICITNWIRDGVEVPEKLTARRLRDEWNRQLSADNAAKSF